MTAPNPASRSQTFRSVLGLAVAALVLLLSFGGARSYQELDAARGRESQLERRLAATRERIRGLERRIERLENDPAMLERLARDELGMVRPDDIVIVLSQPAEPDEAP